MRSSRLLQSWGKMKFKMVLELKTRLLRAWNRDVSNSCADRTRLVQKMMILVDLEQRAE